MADYNLKSIKKGFNNMTELDLKNETPNEAKPVLCAGSVSKDGISLIHGDSLQALRGYGDNHFDIAIVDPPYGINAEQGTNRASRKQFADKKYGWDSKPPEREYFIELQRVSKNQIIWGANHFIEKIPNANSKSWLVWDKKNPDRCFADAELAWCSNIDNVRIIDLKRVQELNRDDYGKIHPTQKPTALYKWLLDRYTSEGDLVLDTHLGSGSIAIACHYMKRKLIGYEIDAEYYEKACKRFEEQTRQTALW